MCCAVSDALLGLQLGGGSRKGVIRVCPEMKKIHLYLRIPNMVRHEHLVDLTPDSPRPHDFSPCSGPLLGGLSHAVVAIWTAILRFQCYSRKAHLIA